MKKVLRNFVTGSAMVLAVSALAGCASVKGAVYEAGTPVKIGLITLHDDQSTYDKNFIDSMKAAVTNLGAKVESVIYRSGVNETNECYKACKDLVKQGCNFIFADSFGHQDFMLKAAKQWPTVTFCHATGTNAKTANLDNYHNAFASIYEGRYLAGVAAGYKLQSMINADSVSTGTDGNYKLGYVGAFPYAEVVSGYTSWFLGVRSVVSNVKMDVQYTYSWYDFNEEQKAANALIDGGAVLLSQHADSMGAPGACETAGVPNVTYNGSTKSQCPTTYVAMSKINWAPYFEEVVNSMYEGRGIANETNHNWTGTLETGSVQYNVDDSTVAATVAGVEAELRAGTRKVFDCSTFTVGDQPVTETSSDTDGDFQGDTNAIKTEGGITFFDESTACSAPYFDLKIDGITEINAHF